MKTNREAYPRISIVTPSYNQGEFLEQTILSVLEQNYPNLEYIIIDGGSTDNSVEIIKKFESHLAYWVSEKDQGQYHAINKGFFWSSGEIMAWLNSDDMYCKWAFNVVADIFGQKAEIEWITTLFPLFYNNEGIAVFCNEMPGFSKDAFYEGRYSELYPQKAIDYIQQESTFWRRSLWERSGGRLSETLGLAADFELWARFFDNANLYGVQVPLSGFRLHDNQKSHQRMTYLEECQAVLACYNPSKEAVARDVIRILKLHRIPLLDRLLNRMIGYKLHSISVQVTGNDTTWHLANTKRFF